MKLLRSLLPLLVLGCGSNPTAGGPFPECDGQIGVIVTNDWTQIVDLYADVEGEASPTALGTVQPGAREEFTLPDATRRVYAQLSSLGQPSRQPNEIRQLVRFRYFCR